MSVIAELPVGAQAKLAPTPYDVSNRPLSGRAFAYSSSAPSVATVDAKGVVTGVSLGAATITATAEGKSATAVVKVIPAVASIVLTPSPASVNVGGTSQLAAALADSLGNVLVGQAVVWTSSDPTVATVSNTGLVTGVANGSCTITATVGTVSASVTLYAGPFAKIIATSAAQGVRLARFRSGRVATTDGVGVQTVPNVPGMPSTATPFTAYQNGGGNTQRPTYDAVNGLVRTNAAAATALVSNWNGELDLSPRRGVYKVMIAAFVTASDGAQMMGIQRASTLAEGAVLQKSFGLATVDCFFNTPAGHSYFWNTNWPTGSTALKLYAWRVPPNGGDDGDLNATPWASSENVGVEGPRGLPHGQVSANQFTPYVNDAYREFVGGNPFGAVGAPGVNTADVIYGDDWTFLDEPTDAVYDAIMEYYLARPGTVAPVSNIDGLVDFLGDSRPRGNGTSDLAHAVPGAMQTALGARWQVENRGIAGDNLDNILLDPYLTQRTARLYHSSRKWHQIFVWCYINSATDSTHYASPGMDGTTALARVTALVGRLRLKYPDKTKVKIVICHETGNVAGTNAAGIAAFNAGLDAMKAAGTIADAVPIEAGTDVLDFADGADYSDGLHPTNLPAGEIGVICANRALALAA